MIHGRSRASRSCCISFAKSPRDLFEAEIMRTSGLTQSGYRVPEGYPFRRVPGEEKSETSSRAVEFVEEDGSISTQL